MPVKSRPTRAAAGRRKASEKSPEESKPRRARMSGEDKGVKEEEEVAPKRSTSRATRGRARTLPVESSSSSSASEESDSDTMETENLDGSQSNHAASQTRRRPLVSMKGTVDSKKNPAKGTNAIEKDDSNEDESYATLIAELITSHEILSNMNQRSDDSEQQLSPELIRLTNHLATLDILTSPSARVRYLSAKCFADILFLHAPDAPFEDATLKRVFQILVESLRGLNQDENTEAHKAAVYVLSRMAICKLGCILVDLPETLPGDGGIATSALSTAMFDTVFESIAPSHSLSVERNAIELLVGYLDEGSDETYPFGVLDSILRRLLPDNRRESHRAYDVARGIIAQCSEKLRSPVTVLLNGMLLGEFERLDIIQDVEESSIKDSVHVIVVELFRIDPNLLLHVLPSIENLLELDDLDSRFKATKLLCEIFLETRSDSIIAEYDRLLVSLMHRVFDKSVEIRRVILQFAGKCLTLPEIPRLLAHVIRTRNVSSTDVKHTLLEAMLLDADKTIRSEAVEICSLILTSWGSLSAETTELQNDEIEQMQSLAKTLAGRLHDVHVDISLRAMDGLSWGYSKHPKHLSWVPSAVLGEECKRDDPADYHRIDEMRIVLIDNAMLGTDDKGTSRVDRLFSFFSSLTSSRARANFFRCVFKMRNEVREQVTTALEQRRARKKVAEFDLSNLPLVTADTEIWKLIWNVPDNRVFERWSELLNPLAKRRTMNEARRDLVERIGAALKSQNVDSEKINKCKGLLKSLTRWSGLWTLCSDELSSSAFIEAANGASLELGQRFIAAFPGAFKRADFLEAVESGEFDQDRIRLVCTVIENVNLRDFSSVTSELRTRLLQFARGDAGTSKSRKVSTSQPTSVKVRKLAAKALIKLSSYSDIMDSDSDSIVELLLSKDAKWTAGDIYVAIVVARSAPEHPINPKLVEYCVDKLKKPYPSSPTEDDIVLKVACLKLIVEFLLQGLRTGAASTSQCKSLLLMLRSFVSDLGDPWTGQSQRVKDTSATVSWPPSNEERFSRLRLASVTALMKIEAAYPKSSVLVEGENEISQVKRQARRFIERARLAFDPSQENREIFLSKMMKIELDQGLNMHRGGAFLAVIAALHEGSQHANRANSDLKQLVKFLGQKSQESKLVDDTRAVLFAPELILPNLIYILAHHPLFPSEESEYAAFLKSKQSLLTGPIVQLLDALTAAHGKSQGRMDFSVSFMLAALSAIRSRKDILDDRHGIHCVGDLARLVIQEHVRYTPAALESFKFRVPLPKVFLEPASFNLEPHTPTQARESSVAPSPISYLPAGFSLATSSGKKRVRAHSKISRSANNSSIKKPRKTLTKRLSDTSSSAKATRSQPKRRARLSTSYVEASDTSDSDDPSSSEESSSADESDER